MLQRSRLGLDDPADVPRVGSAPCRDHVSAAVPLSPFSNTAPSEVPKWAQQGSNLICAQQGGAPTTWAIVPLNGGFSSCYALADRGSARAQETIDNTL